jgi:hypothetical protein
MSVLVPLSCSKSYFFIPLRSRYSMRKKSAFLTESRTISGRLPRWRRDGPRGGLIRWPPEFNVPSCASHQCLWSCPDSAKQPHAGGPGNEGFAESTKPSRTASRQNLQWHRSDRSSAAQISCGAQPPTDVKTRESVTTYCDGQGPCAGRPATHTATNSNTLLPIIRPPL